MRADGRSGCALLAVQMQRLLAERGRHDLAVAFQSCLWSCKQHCNVLLSDLDRYTYLAGDFTPERASAEALLTWFDLHGQSATGEVPFRDWPQGMRGQFIARIPPRDDSPRPDEASSHSESGEPDES